MYQSQQPRGFIPPPNIRGILVIRASSGNAWQTDWPLHHSQISQCSLSKDCVLGYLHWKGTWTQQGITGKTCNRKTRTYNCVHTPSYPPYYMTTAWTWPDYRVQLGGLLSELISSSWLAVCLTCRGIHYHRRLLPELYPQTWPIQQEPTTWAITVITRCNAPPTQGALQHSTKNGKFSIICTVLCCCTMCEHPPW